MILLFNMQIYFYHLTVFLSDLPILGFLTRYVYCLFELTILYYSIFFPLTYFSLTKTTLLVITREIITCTVDLLQSKRNNYFTMVSIMLDFYNTNSIYFPHLSLYYCFFSTSLLSPIGHYCYFSFQLTISQHQFIFTHKFIFSIILHSSGTLMGYSSSKEPCFLLICFIGASIFKKFLANVACNGFFQFLFVWR